MKKMLLTLSFFVLGAYAQAGVTGPAWTCKLGADSLKGHGFSFVITKTTLEGEGKVTCTSPQGTYSAPVKVEVDAFGVGLVVGAVNAQNLDIVGAAVGVKDLDYVFGTYPGVRGTASFIGGEVSLALNFGANEHGVELGAKLLGSVIGEGFRFGVAGEAWKLHLEPLNPDEPWTPEPTQPPTPTPAY